MLVFAPCARECFFLVAREVVESYQPSKLLPYYSYSK